MRASRHDTYAVVFDVVYLGLMTNVLLLVAMPPAGRAARHDRSARSWPLLALIAAACARPGIARRLRVPSPMRPAVWSRSVRSLLAGWRATWRKALAIGAMRAVRSSSSFSSTSASSSCRADRGRRRSPFSLVIAVLTLATTLLALVALAEVPGARLRDIAEGGAFC